MLNCCSKKINKKTKKCIRQDKKSFNLSRKFSKSSCLNKKIKGFSKKSSCAPYKFCKKNKQFLYNPDNPKKSFDVYIDKNPKDTISIKYKTINDVKKTIKKLEKLFKNDKYSHKRIWQVGMILKVRLEALKKHKKKLYPNAKNVDERYNLALKYFLFLRKRTKLNKVERKKFTFNF